MATGGVAGVLADGEEEGGKRPSFYVVSRSWSSHYDPSDPSSEAAGDAVAGDVAAAWGR